MNMLEKTLHNVGKIASGIILASALTFCETGITPDSDKTKEEILDLNPPSISISAEKSEPYRWMQLSIKDNNNDDYIKCKIEKANQDGYTYTYLTSTTGEYQDRKNIEANKNYKYRVCAHNTINNKTSNWVYAEAKSVGLQEGSIKTFTKADTFVYENYPDNNWGNYSSIEVGTKQNYTGGEAIGLLKFDLPELPSHAKEYQGTTLNLSDASGGRNSYNAPINMTAWMCLGEWDENSATYNNLPTKLGGNQGEITKYADDSQGHIKEIKIDVSKMISEWKNGFPNHGILLQIAGEDNYWAFYSKEAFSGNGSAMLEMKYEW